MCEVSEDVHPVCTDEQLATMRARGGRWAGYQCKALDSSQAGTYVFLKFGPGCTYEAPPMHAPDEVLVIKNGHLVASGGPELAAAIEKNGFSDL
jgi:hypothetical protein